MSRVVDQELTERACHLRHTLGWPVWRIARVLRMRESAVSHLLKRTRAEQRLGPRALPPRRLVRPISLSVTYNV
jgi:hypothetical protein